jgi:hypothetical protein
MSKMILIEEAKIRQALEALAASDDFLFNYHDCEPNNEREMDAYSEIRANNHEAYTALRTAIEQAGKQEPVIPAGIITAIRNAGLTLIKTQQGYVLQRIEGIKAQATPPAAPYRAVKTVHEGKPVYVSEPAAPVKEPVKHWCTECKGHDTHKCRFNVAITPAAPVQNCNPAEDGVCEALECCKHQPAVATQKPVAWYDEKHDYSYTRLELGGDSVDGLQPLYTTPPAAQRQWVGLTDEEINACDPQEECWGLYEAVRRAEAKLREKNGGGA